MLFSKVKVCAKSDVLTLCRGWYSGVFEGGTIGIKVAFYLSVPIIEMYQVSEVNKCWGREVPKSKLLTQ